MLLGLWLASGFGWRIRSPYFAGIHYDLVQCMLVVFFREARRVLALRIRTDGPHPPRVPGGPMLVCCRHAGPGDSFILMYALLHWYHREPRVVLKDTLAWDPAIDVVLQPHPGVLHLAQPRGGRGPRAQIARAGERPRRQRRLRDLPRGRQLHRRRAGTARSPGCASSGLERMAERAEQMTNVLAPRPGGFLAALDAAPEADVVLVAHTGLDHMLTVGDVWRELPMDKQIIMRWWEVPRAEIPEDRDERIDWLFGWWERIDAWIDENRVDGRCRAVGH